MTKRTKHITHSYSSKRLTKTEIYLKQNYQRKNGIFLPTPSQYQQMTPRDRGLVRNAIRKLNDVHHPARQDVGFDQLSTMWYSGMYGKNNVKRDVKQSRVYGNLKNMNKMDRDNAKAAKERHKSYDRSLSKDLQFKYGMYKQNADKTIMLNYARFNEMPLKTLMIKPDEVAHNASDYNVYESNGIWIVSYKADNTLAAKFKTSMEAYRYVAEHNAMEATEYF